VRPNDPANHDELLAMYLQGMGDSAIGKRVGRTKWAIGRWRRYHGLARFCVDPMKLTEDEEAKRRTLYDLGLLDAEIAGSLNIGFSGVYSWRKRNALPPNCKSRKVKYQSQFRETCNRLLRRNVSPRVLSEVFDIPIENMAYWRTAILHAHPELGRHSRRVIERPQTPNGKQYSRLLPERRREAFEQYSLGQSDTAIALEMKLWRQQIREWRKAYDLAPNVLKRQVRTRLRAPPVAFQPIRPDRDVLYARIRRALRGDWATVDDAASDLYLAVIEGRLEIEQIEVVANQYRNRVIADYASAFGPISLNKAIPGTKDLMMIDTLRDERSSDWLEEMGATVW
jgi:hypothetical protein